MGQSTAKVLDDVGVVTQHVNDAALVGETVFAAAMMAFQTCRPVAVLIGQRVVGFKDWSK
jgi:sulfopyruvate decarboxylase TPP-binding subunit